MIFNSLEFLIFLPVVFLLYAFVQKYASNKAVNLFLIASSYYFYGRWDWRFLGLIVFTSLCSYWSGLLLEKFTGRHSLRKAVNILNIVLNLGVLAVFKYYNFFAESFAGLFSAFGYQMGWVSLNVVLPVGVSFYTFQALSYSIDVYRNRLEPTHDMPAFFAYISFFPQLVAGPIERAVHLLPQFSHKRPFDYTLAVQGMRQMLWGFFKKVVVADNCAVVVDQVFSHYTDYSANSLVWAGILFSFQIYGDFSGYSDIAIGCAKLFGIRLMDNFKVPYFSRNIAEFWRRWHISLTSWFRDYVYIPLGGNRVNLSVTIRNTLIVFLLSGLWHGANWTFVFWGLYHALLFIPLLLANRNRLYLHTEISENGFQWKEILQCILCFALVVIGWIIFRSESVGAALDYLCRCFDSSLIYRPKLDLEPLVYIGIMLVAEFLQRRQEGIYDLDRISSAFCRNAIYAVLLFLIWYKGGSSEAFIYFQF